MIFGVEFARAQLRVGRSADNVNEAWNQEEHRWQIGVILFIYLNVHSETYKNQERIYEEHV